MKAGIYALTQPHYSQVIFALAVFRLYSSPKPPTPQQSSINLYKWVRQDFDHPSPEVESARRSLLFKLNEVARSEFIFIYGVESMF